MSQIPQPPPGPRDRSSRRSPMIRRPAICCAIATASMAPSFAEGCKPSASPSFSQPRSPWENPFVERVIGTIRRELLDHVIVLNEGDLRRRLRSYLRYYHGSRTHLALEKDAPEPRAVEPPEYGRVVALPQVGGLHHRYIRRAA